MSVISWKNNSRNIGGKFLRENFKANSLDSLANSSNQSESMSDESQDSDSGTESKAKAFQVKCEVYAEKPCGSLRSWTNQSSANSETSYEYVTSEYFGTDGRNLEQKVSTSERRYDQNGRMETIPEEYEPKVSVKEILARFENLRDEKEKAHEAPKKDKNNNNCVIENRNLDSVHEKKKKNKDQLKNKDKEKDKYNKRQQDNVVYSASATLQSCSVLAHLEANNTKVQKGSDKDIIVNSKTLSSGGPPSSSSSGPISSSSSATSTSSNSTAALPEKEIQAKAQRSRSPDLPRLEIMSTSISPKPREEMSPTRHISRDESRDGARSPNSPVPQGGKFSLMQYAMQNFRQMSDMEHQRTDTVQQKPKQKSKDWTWKQQTDVIKWQGDPIEGPLLKMDDPELTPLAIECFECILKYCGDQPLTPDMSEVKCVYTVLMHCHKYAELRDEVYSQLMKQTTSNKSESPESSQRAWRLLSIVAAYFACSENLLPYLMEHLASAANDRRRICHGTAAVCVTNLRKTQRCGGRKNVPSVEEVTAVSAGRSARRQIYRLPGGAERVVNTRCSTVVADVIQELCGLIGVNSEAEQQEFSLYCIVQGDAFTMPLAADEYILDVTTELHKSAQPFYLIFCRSVWYHPLKHDASALYTEVLFNQVAPDYLEGLLLRLGNPNLPPSVVRDMALVAALLHRAADLGHSPSLKEVKFLLPKPVLGLREPRPPQWLALVQTSWGQAAGMSVSRAKHRVLQVLSSWPLFGSSFFAVKRVIGEPEHWQEHILALNRGGVHFLDMNTHETLQHWPFAEVISTRKVRSEDGALFLDMKCGNLLQQRVTRLQTEQAHEISRLVRQYINLEQEHSSRK